MSSKANNGLHENSNNCKQFKIDNPKFSKIFQILFNNTQYYRRSQIITDLENEIEQWKRERSNIPLYVVLPIQKIGSEHYFYYQLKNRLPKHSIILNVFPQINEESELLYLDDWSLTGYHCWQAFNDIIFIDEDHEKPRYPNVLLKCTIIVSITSNEVLTSFRSDENLSFVPQCTFNFYYSHIVRKFIDILKENGINYDDNNIYEEESSKNFKLIIDFFNKYNSGKITAYPVHLDYKIANVDGSFPNIYINCRDNPNKRFMKETHKYFGNIKRDPTMYNSEKEEMEKEENLHPPVDWEYERANVLKNNLSKEELEKFNSKFLEGLMGNPSFDYLAFLKNYFRNVNSSEN